MKIITGTELESEISGKQETEWGQECFYKQFVVEKEVYIKK